MSKERERAADLARRLERAYGEELVSVALYGSAARGDYREGVSDLNVLVVLRRLDAELLLRGGALAREWAAGGNPPPLMMSEAEWHGSADVFAIEFADLRDAHLVLSGEDLFGGLRVRWRDLRLQCERELKQGKIRLRERFLLAAGAPEELGTLLRGSFPTFLTLFRAALRLVGEPVPAESEAVVRRVAERAGFDPVPFLEVRQARAQAGAFAPAADGPVAAGYLDGVGRMSDWLDGLAPGGAPEWV